MTVKVKTKNKISQDQRLTLDAIHQKQVKKFQNLKKSIPHKRKEIQKIRDQIKKIEKEGQENKSDPTILFELMDQKRILELKIKELENEITEIENGKPEEQYLLDVGHAMAQYYINRKNHSLEENTSVEPRKKKNKKVKDVFDLFENYNKKKQEENDDNEEEQQQERSYSRKTSSSSESQQEKTARRKQMSATDIYNHVMTNVDRDFVPDDDHPTQENEECPYCETDRELYQSEGKLVCPKCFFVDFILIDSDKPSYRDTPKEMTNFAYKRRNHFIEVLSQYQGRETTEIPEEVYMEILQELKKNRITKATDLTNVKLRSILKKIDQNRYYEHIPFIIYQLTGIKPPTITSKIRKRLIEMFNEIQIPFSKYCPPDRRNFLSYSYILYKFFELLELDEHLPYLNLLKSRDKLHQQDVIWERICEDLRWEYIASV